MLVQNEGCSLFVQTFIGTYLHKCDHIRGSAGTVRLNQLSNGFQSTQVNVIKARCMCLSRG